MMKHILLLLISLCSVCCSEDINQEEPNNTPYDVFSITDLAVSGESLYAATYHDGLFYLEDGKDLWQRIQGFIIDTPLLAVSETTAYAMYGGYIHRLDKGNSERWVNISTARGWGDSRNEGMWSFLVVDDTLYTGMANGRIYRATGNERPSWVAVANTTISSLAISGTTLYAGSGGYPYFPSYEGEGVFRSTDGGVSWAPVNTGLTEHNVTSLAVSGTTVYAGTRDGVFRLENDDSWTHVGLSGSNVASLVAESGTTRLYAGTYGDGVFRSPDGVSWRSWGLAGLPNRALAVSDKYLYAGTLGSPSVEGGAGIFRTGIFRRRTNPGAYDIWTPINQGLTKVRY